MTPSKRFEELDWRETPMGEISLRRRVEPSLQVDVYEVKLGDEYLMSSLFTVAEVELARLGLAETDRGDLDVLVGGLGLGYTADAALDDSRVRSLTVVDAIPEVIEWHERRLLPHTVRLTQDPRTQLLHRDFFAAVRAGGFGPDVPERYDVVLLDVDHTPRHVLDPSHADFYTAAGLARLRVLLEPGGVFALWSDDPPDEDFMAVLGQSFTSSSAHVVTFPNPLTGSESANTVYVARR
jgi:spermidine synthase